MNAPDLSATFKAKRHEFVPMDSPPNEILDAVMSRVIGLDKDRSVRPSATVLPEVQAALEEFLNENKKGYASSEGPEGPDGHLLLDQLVRLEIAAIAQQRASSCQNQQRLAVEVLIEHKSLAKPVAVEALASKRRSQPVVDFV